MAVATLDLSLDAGLTEEEARSIFAQGEEAVVFAILELSKRLAEQKQAETYASRRQRLTVRLQDLIDTDWRNTHTKRLISSLLKKSSSAGVSFMPVGAKFA